ncbi:helix-turn-helix transcriptional regulator [Candidatus Palauibacter sp.]|uniref:helix-turn-helix transcriptional regulator n=1 Tax=Candidatus Palauibacter sp. TaxID=3101350 RepID=UPI003B01E2DA
MEGQNGLHLRFDGPDGSHVLWVLTDPIAADWGFDQLAMVERLGPHVRQFVIVQQALAEAGALKASMGQLLEGPGFGLIHLDPNGRIVEANDRIRGFFREGDRLIDRRGYVRARAPAEDSELSRLLESALPRFGRCGAAGSMMVGRRATRGPLILHVNPVAERERFARSRRVAALVLIMDPARPAPIEPALVEVAMGLTPTESRLAVALAAGQTLRDIALAAGCTEQTVRWHMKQIFRKQGISRQVDLVRRVLRLGGIPASRARGAQ